MYMAINVLNPAYINGFSLGNKKEALGLLLGCGLVGDGDTIVFVLLVVAVVGGDALFWGVLVLVRLCRTLGVEGLEDERVLLVVLWRLSKESVLLLWLCPLSGVFDVSCISCVSLAQSS